MRSTLLGAAYDSTDVYKNYIMTTSNQLLQQTAGASTSPNRQKTHLTAKGGQLKEYSQS
jgi:hypothetical protein